MKKILFPTEFSAHAPEVFKYAADIAYFFKAKLVMMHAFSKPEFTTVADTDLEKKADEVSTELIDFVAANLPEEYGKLKVEYVTQTGDATAAILEVAKEEKIDLIVMGMTGKKNALDVIFGTTTLDVLSKAVCPVLIVPVGATFEGIDNIIYATKFQFGDLAGINYVKKWGRAFDATVHCLHVADKGKAEEQAIRKMNTLQETYRKSKRISGTVLTGSFRKEIDKFVRIKKADVVTLLSHKRGFIEKIRDKNKVINMIAREGRIPLLIVKAK